MKSERRFPGFVLLSCLTLVFTSVVAQSPDRSGPPKLGPTPSLQIPQIQEFRLSNGLPVLMLEKHQVPLVQLNVLVRAGSALDPEGGSGLASMVADMLDEGAGTRDALELADAVEYLGASVSTRSSFHTTTVALFTPRGRLQQAVELLADVVMHPTFPQSELDRLRKEGLTELLQAHDEPRAIAEVAFNRALFGTDHPYGAPGDLESPLRKVSTDDLRKFHSAYFRPNNSALLLVGDVKNGEVLPVLEKFFGKWEAADVDSPSWQTPEQSSERRVLLVNKPEAAQSEIRIGSIGVDRRTEDYYALTVMNTILGGSFASRLNQNLREEHGYTYGAFSSFSFRQLPGPFMAASSVQTDVTDKALTEFVKELNGILSEVSDEELVRAKNYVALQFPQRFQGVGQIAGQLAQLYAYQLPLDYFNSFTSRILAVTKADVLRVARQYLNPETMTCLIVGDQARIEEGIRALNLGSIETLSIEDVLGPRPKME